MTPDTLHKYCRHKEATYAESSTTAMMREASPMPPIPIAELEVIIRFERGFEKIRTYQVDQQMSPKFDATVGS
jgi:hypothetical protein